MALLPSDVRAQSQPLPFDTMQSLSRGDEPIDFESSSVKAQKHGLAWCSFTAGLSGAWIKEGRGCVAAMEATGMKTAGLHPDGRALR